MTKLQGGKEVRSKCWSVSRTLSARQSKFLFTVYTDCSILNICQNNFADILCCVWMVCKEGVPFLPNIK